MVDWELRKRDAALALDKEVLRKQDVLKDLEGKIEKMEEDHQNWMAQHQAASDAEMQHRRSMMEAERAHMVQLADAEKAISTQRIAALAALESASAEEMALMDVVTKEASQLLQDGERHLSEKLEATMQLQKHR